MPETGALAAQRELLRVKEQISDVAVDLTTDLSAAKIKGRLDGLRTLLDAIARFIARLNTISMNESTGQLVVKRLEVLIQFQGAVQALTELVGLLETAETEGHQRTASILQALSNTVRVTSSPQHTSGRKRHTKAMLKEFRRSQRNAILKGNAEGRIDLREANHTLQVIAAASHFSEQWAKASNNLAKLMVVSSSNDDSANKRVADK